MRLLQASPAASSEKTQPPFLLPSCMSSPFARILHLHHGFPLYFFEKMRYTMKHHLWRCSQALRRGACKPLIPVFNSGHRLQPSNSCTCRSSFLPKRAIFDNFKDSPFLQNGLACDSESIGIRIALPSHFLTKRTRSQTASPASCFCRLR